MTFIKFCQPDRSVNIKIRILDPEPINQGLGAEGGEEFSFNFQSRTDFRVRVASDRILQRLRDPFFWDVVSRHWEIGTRSFGTALCSLLQESNSQ